MDERGVRLRPPRRRLRHRLVDAAAEEEPRHRRAGAGQGGPPHRQPHRPARDAEGPAARLQPRPPGGQGAAVRLGRPGVARPRRPRRDDRHGDVRARADAGAADAESTAATDLAEQLVRRRHAVPRRPRRRREPSCAVTSTKGARSPSWRPPTRPRAGGRRPRRPRRVGAPSHVARGRRAGAGRRPARGVPPSSSSATPNACTRRSAHAGVAGGDPRRSTSSVSERASLRASEPSSTVFGSRVHRHGVPRPRRPALPLAAHSLALARSHRHSKSRRTTQGCARDPSAHPPRPVRRVRHAGRGVQRPLPRLLRRRADGVDGGRVARGGSLLRQPVADVRLHGEEGRAHLDGTVQVR